jgi:hypothetical protein
MVQVPLRFTGPPGRPTPRPPAPSPPPPRVPPGRTTPVGSTPAPAPSRGVIAGQENRAIANNPPVAPVRSGGVSAPPPPSGGGGKSSNIDWRDSAYNAQIAAIERALRDFETGLSTRGQRYGEDFVRGVKDLGFRAGEGFVAAPDILGFRDLEEGLAAVRRPMGAMARTMGEDGQEMPMTAAQMMGGQWDYEGDFNPFSAATRGTRTARDDFAGRGVLRSSDFAKSYAEFQDRLNQQLEAMETGRGRFFEDALTNLSSQRASAEERKAAAQRDAMMRAAIQAGR